MLTWIVTLPMFTAIVVLLFPSRTSPRLLQAVASAGSLVTAAMVLIAAAPVFEGGSDLSSQAIASTETHGWVDALGISWSLRLDGLSVLMVLLTAGIFSLVIAALGADHSHKAYYVLLLLLETGSLGAFLANDLFLFFCFFEVILVPMYFLIGRWGHGDRTYAANKFFIYTMAASALMLVGISVFAFSASPDQLTFNVSALTAQMVDSPMSYGTSLFVFCSFALAFAVKVPVVALHTWLPNAHTEAPTAGSVVLAAVLLKLGAYGLIRFCVSPFGDIANDLAPVFMALGVIGIIYGAVVATMQSDLKRLVAYSSIAHMGFIVLGIFAMTLNGLNGAVLQMFNHGVSTGALFILIGFIYERRHTREIAELSGMARSAPVLAGVFTLVMFSSIGLPGLNGFVGEFLILVGTFTSPHWIWAIPATVGVILAAVYMLWAYQRTFHGKPATPDSEMADLNWREIATLAPLLVLIVALGLFPQRALDYTSTATREIVERVGEIHHPVSADISEQDDDDRKELWASDSEHDKSQGHAVDDNDNDRQGGN